MLKFKVGNTSAILTEENLQGIENFMYNNNMSDVDFTVISEGKEKGMYTRFDGKYRKIEDRK